MNIMIIRKVWGYFSDDDASPRVGVNTNDIWSACKISATLKFSAECPGELEAKLERIDISNVAEKKVSAHSDKKNIP